MKRWRPLAWLVVSVACFIAAIYFWRLGDKWQAQKPAQPTAPAVTSNTPAAQSNSTNRHMQMKSTAVISASTAPVVALNPPASNSPVYLKTNGFPFRLSNTTRTVGQLSRDNHAILLENALIDSSSSVDLSIPDSLKSHGDPGAYLVQAQSPMNDYLRGQIDAAGATRVSYFPNNTYLVTATPAEASVLSRNFVVRPWEPYFKVKTSLMRSALAGEGVTAANVAVFPGMLDQTKAALEQMGATVGPESQYPFGWQIPVQNIKSVAEVAGLPGIQEIEPAVPRITANDLTRPIMSDSFDSVVPTNYLGLSGSNVLVAVADSFIRTNGPTLLNPDLMNIVIPPAFFPVGMADTEGHGTHVGGIIAGSGLHSPTNAVGSVPGADFRGKAPLSTILALPALSPFVPDAVLQQAAALSNAPISNNSWDYTTSDYNLAAADYDQAVRDSLPGMPGSQPVLYVWAAGNSGQGDDSGLGGSPDTVLSPAVSKNGIAVGASELPRNITNDVYVCDSCNTNFTGCTTNKPWQGMTDSSTQVARFSSRGNVGIGIEGDFGRFKPDVVAPGTFVVSTRSPTWDQDAYYNPVTDDTTSFFNETAPTNGVTFYSTFVPCDALSLSITAVPVHPNPFNLPIYGRGGDFPVPPGDLLGSNSVTGTITGGPDFTLSPVDTFWYYAVGNPTNEIITYDVFSDVRRTNELGTYWGVLRTNLNDALLSSNSPVPLYRYESGTSMAAPAVAGTLALMEDFFTNRLHYTPSPALLKALLINGARSIDPIYDFQVQNGINYQGWGLVNLTNSLPPGITNVYNAAAATIFLDQNATNALATGDTRTLFVQVNSNAQSAPLRITLVWTDPPGNPAASIKLVNNLDLIVTNLDNIGTTNPPVVFFGNNFQVGSVYTAQWDGNTTNIPSDNVNNVENVYIPGFLGTNYSITVAARNVNVNAVTAHTNGVVQDYALVISSANGDFTNALTLTDGPIAQNYQVTLTTVTNQFADSPDTSGGLLIGQHVGASSPLQGTNELALSNQFNWGNNGQIRLGVTNQWHFYVITNTMGTNATVTFTNAAFATFLPPTLSIPPVGVSASDPSFATRPEADIDLYVARGPDAWKLTNLDLTVVGNSFKSLTRGGTEFLVFSNAQPNEVFYIGVHSEDQEAAEYDFLALFSENPFSQMGPNGEEYIHGLNVPTLIPDGSPETPGRAFTIAIAVQPITVRRVVVTNIMEHENFGDLVGTLTHNRIPVVLNNHTFGNGTTNQTFIYEDNDEGDVPGAVHPDGPGRLQDFIGQEAVGLWMLEETDNALFNTGRVDNVFIKIDPQEGTNGVVATIPPNHFFYDFIDVPPAGTNLTVCVDFIPPSLGPVQLYIRYGQEPTLGNYDYTKVINSPGDCLSISSADFPPLKPGRYYVGIFNPTAQNQTVRLTWTITLDPNGVDPIPITSPSPIMPLPDDAVTNNTIVITNDASIVSVNVGVVIKHPRISDLDLTLVAPTGQRILLFENRGGLSATNMGHLNVFTNFFGATSSGDDKQNDNQIGPIPTFGTLIINYDFFDLPDRLDVYDGNLNIFSSGLISGSNTFTIPYNLVNGNVITIVMNQGNNSNPGTKWTYTPRIVSQDFTYLTFTDDTNLTDMPIKFAIPPYDSTEDGTNYTLSSFETGTNGEFMAVTNIPDAFGGWTMTKNDVFIRTNYFAGTNLLSMASNQVSIVNDPHNASTGSNFLALARGSISRTISLTPGREYTIDYFYRGPGIAGWWRGEGNAADSSDPELLGNNGSLIGRFNFPAGEVGQAFAMEDPGLAFQFAGTNTYVQVPQSPTLDVGTGSGFTVEGWINPTNITFRQPMVEWLAHVPANSIVNGQSVSNLTILAGPFLNRETSHYYYLLGQTNWATSELWANALGGHLVEADDANEQNWVYDTFAQFAGSNYTTWIGLSKVTSPTTNFVWSTGNNNVVYTNWAFGEPTNCPTAQHAAILSATNGLPGLWTLLDDNGLTCNGGPTNKPFGVVEVNDIQANGVQFWISVTNAANPGLGRLYANIFDTNGVPHEIFSPAGLIQSNVYQHVALTYDTNNGMANLYYAGTNVASANLGVFVPKTGGDVLIGKDMSRATNNFFWGRMDEMSIYSRFLSPSEILAIYNISAGTTNRNIGKFDPAITPAESLGEAQVSFGGITNVIFGNNNGWQVQGFSLKASSNTLPVQITGIEPGVLLDSFSVFQKPPENLYYFPEQPLQALVGSNAVGPWTLEIRDARTGAIATNAELDSWQLQFILQTNTPTPIQLDPQTPHTNSIPPGQIAYYTVFVPSWANNATNILVSASSGVDFLFNQTAPPATGAAGDVVFAINSTSFSQMISAVPPSIPPLRPGQTYYLAVANNGAVPAQVVIRVDFNMTTLTDGVPFTGTLGANDVERPFVFNVSSNATEATFQLLKMTGNADLVLRKGLPLPTLLSADYGSFSGTNADEIIYVLTNSLPVPLSQGPWYLDVIKRTVATDSGGSNAITYSVLAKQLTNAPTVVTLSNRVPMNFTAGPGAALTNFFKFSVANFPLTGATNLGIHFELFNQTGNGDLTVQTNALPLAPPFLQSSRLPFDNAEIIFIRTNASSSTNLNADWYLGVPNNEIVPLNFTIVAEIDTNSFSSFPTAEGSGSDTRGGALRTNVYHVTSLADSGFGSFRDGVNTLTNGGTIVFDRFGTITLSAPLFITNSFLTIAGQTAPGSGITVVGAPTIVQNAHDLIIRYLRFRPDTNNNNIDINGSFENPPGAVTYFAGQTFGGWSVLTGSIDHESSSSGAWQAADGVNSLDMNGFTAGAISRTVPTVAGKTYNLRFAYSANPDGGINPRTMQALWNGTVLGTITAFTNGVTFANMHWIYTNFTVVGTGSDVLEFASTTTTGLTQFGPTLDAVSLTSGVGDSLRVTNASNVVFDHISAEFGATNDISVLNSSNVTVQWSVLAESENQLDASSGGSAVRYGSGDVTFHHNLYADNYGGNPTVGEDVSLDFVNNVIFNWGVFAGFSTNDLANNPGGLTNFLNYSANYLIAGSNSVFTNMAFWSGSPNTWIFQTNNFIDTNKNAILDGANTSWGMFSNQYTPFSHAFDISPPTAPDEAFIAYERVLDFAGTSLEKRDRFDRNVVQRTRLQPAVTNATSLLSGMAGWWPGEGNGNDATTNGNNLILQSGVTFGPGEVGQAFQLLNSTNGFMHAPASSNLNVGAAGKGVTMEGWINVSSVSGLHPIAEYDGNARGLNGVQLWLNANPGQSGALFTSIVETNFTLHDVVSPPGIIQPNVFQHVAMTYDQASGQVTLYVNGAVVTQANVGSFVPLTSYDLWFGHRPFDLPGDITYGTYLGGSLDEFSVYNRALTPCEIADIYNAGSAGKKSVFAAATNSPVSQLPYLDVDRDAIPDFWEITLNENATNFSANLDRDGDGYTDLEEYMNWLGAPHALTLHNTQTNIDLYTLSGNTGNLLFGVANGTNGTVYLTNTDACAGNAHVAVFTPANNFGNGTNGGFASFSYMVTNTDTRAYFGPVTVSVFVSTVAITNSGLSTNIITFTNPPANQATYETVPYGYTNGAVDSDPTALLSYSISTVINTNAMIANGWPLTNLTTSPFPSVDSNTGIITWTPTEQQGPGVYTITTVVADNGIPPTYATNTFDLTVLESNLPPVFVGTPPNLTNIALAPITVTNSATDPDNPFNPLGYTLLNPPAGMTIDTNGVITWTPALGQVGTNIITTVVTDTNIYAPFNKNLSVTNVFTIVINPVVPPFVFTQPAQAVTLTSARLNGMATPNGLPTMAWFEWGTNTLYGNQTTPVNVGNSFNVVYTNANISGLIPNVPYHFRMVVSNVFGGPFYGFDQILDQAHVVAWGADYVRQIEVPPGLSNAVAVAGAYDHSLALKDDGTVIAWGDDTFGQTNVPPGLNSVLAIAGGQYNSMALKNNGTVVSWGPNLLNVTNVPPGLNNVVMIASGTTASLALRNNGSVVSWGANLFNVTNPPAGLNNVVEVAGGSYHSLAIRNNGTVVAWGDNSAGQTNVPPSATNVVAIAGGNYHSLALRYDGTVVSWGDNSAGQTNVPAGLSNVVAIAAGGFHSLALKSDGTVVGWGDNTAGQAGVPTGLTNVVAISAGYFHNLALTPSLVLTNPIVLPTTNGLPQTNSILGDTTVFYRVDVPPDADAATNELLFTVNGPLNIWYSTNTPPTVGTPADFHLLTNSINGTSLVTTATSPQLIPGSTYYLGVQNTNNFAISYAVQVDFHLTATGPLTNTVPISGIIQTNINGTNGFLLIWFAPTNDLFQVQWANGLPPVWNTFTNIIGYHQFINPTNSEFEFFDDGTQSGGLTPGRYYQLILLNGTTPPPSPPTLTNGVPVTTNIAPGTVTFYQVNVPTNVDFVTNSLLPSTSPLNLWFTTNVPPTVAGATDYLLVSNATSGSFTSTVGSGAPPTFIPGATYYLGVQNTNATAVNYGVRVDFHFLANQPLTNTVPISGVIQTNRNGTNGFLLVWFAPTNDLFQVQWAAGLPPVWNTFTNIISYHTFINPTNSEFEFFDDGSQTGGFSPGRYYQLILLNGGVVTAPAIPVLTNGVPATDSIPSGTTSFYQVNVPANVDFVTNSLLPSSASLNLWFTTNVPPTVAGATDYLLVSNAASGSFTSTAGSGAPPSFVPGTTYYLGVQNTNATAVNYGVRVDFHFLASQPQTNTVPISSVIQTNRNGTNGFLLVWFAPTNDQFQVQWAAGLPPVWSTFTNIVSYHTFINPTNSEFEFFDDGSQTGGFASGRYYQLILLNSGGVTPPPPPSTNVPPISSINSTNVGGTNNFLLTWFAPTNEQFQVQWSSNPASGWNTFTNIIGYSRFISPTNSEFTFLDDGSQSGGLGAIRFYRLVLYNSAGPSISVVPLINGVPVNFTTGAGLTNFFSFDITQTNAAVLFELYNLSGNGDLTAQQNSLPTSSPSYASTNAGTNFEQIVLRTNGALPNLNAISWFLGVPNQSASPISYTIRATVPTNGMLVSGQPLSSTYGRPGGTNVQIVWGPTIPGEKYEIRTNGSLGSPNWIARTDIVATGTSSSFTDPALPPLGTMLFYEVVQVP